MPLPPNVFRVIRSRRSYYYWQAGRSRPKAERSKLVRIPHQPDEAAFWVFCERLNGTRPASDAGTFSACIREFKASPDWPSKASTRKSYSIYLGYAEQAWGADPVAGLTTRAAVALRDLLAREISPNTANQALRALSSFLGWCVVRGYAERNAARDVPRLKHSPEITPPWSEEAWIYVSRNAPAPIARMAILGRATGQRISDLVRMRPADRLRDGIMVPGSITKTGRRHWCAVSSADLAMIDAWECGQMVPWLTVTPGKRPSADAIRHSLSQWLASDAGAPVRAEGLSPHGLRAMAVCDARMTGMEHQDIASLFGMSIGMVQRYSTHIDAEIAGRKARDRRDGTGTGVKTFLPIVKTD